MNADRGIERASFRDPRMRGFQDRATVEQFHDWIDATAHPLVAVRIALGEAADRVLAATVTTATAVPPFDRAAMDGYAVRGEETFGADTYTPASFDLVGDARPGMPHVATVGPGQAVRIMTGAPMPAGTDAVARVEATTRVGMRVEVFESFPPGRHVGARGEDFLPGVEALPAGRRLRPQDLALLSALGIAAVPVVERPRVTIVVTGGELLPPGTPARDFRIPDSNSPMLEALVRRDGGIPSTLGPLADDPETLRGGLISVAGRSDFVIVSGGSSTGLEDHAPSLVAELGTLPLHGVALRPASPTGLGAIGRVPVLLLPGNPVSCLCGYDFFGGRIVRRLGGRATGWPYPEWEGTLGTKLSSVLGRVDYVRVWIDADAVWPITASGASLLSTSTAASGFTIVPADSEGFPEGARIRVWRFDPPG